MTTQELGMCVVSAPLAAIDRRALSQAWYSALHLAHVTPGGATVQARPAVPLPPVRSDRFAPVPVRAKKSFAIRRSALRTRGTLVRVSGETDRRAPRTALALRIERAFLRSHQPARRGSFTIDGAGARVHITLETRPHGAHLIAVCTPACRAVVARALEEVRFALAARGMRLRVTLEA